MGLDFFKRDNRRKIDFNGMSTCLGSFYASEICIFGIVVYFFPVT